MVMVDLKLCANASKIVQVVYYLHGEIGWFSLWANGKKNP